MVRHAVRALVCAGMLAAGLAMSGAGGFVAVAEPGDAGSDGAEGPTVDSKTETGSESSGGNDRTPGDRPTSTVGSGREDTAAGGAQNKDTSDAGWPKPRQSVQIWIPRLPKAPTDSEAPAGSLPDPSDFYTTVEVPVPTLADVVGALEGQPEPSPAPGPAFRGRQEDDAPPVVDATTGGSDTAEAGIAAAPPILSVPIVVAPVRPVTPAGAIGTSAGNPAQGVAVDAVAVGVRAPQLTGSLPETVQTAPAGSPGPMSGRATRLGDPRFLRNPTAGELAAVALPGVGGLLFFTFGGGVIGYRQANCARLIRSTAAERFLR